MQNFEFISHEAFPDDQYIMEIVYMQVSGIRIAYAHKKNNSGGSYWDVFGQSVNRNGMKEMHKAVKFGDSFLSDDIKEFLKRRRWENSTNQSAIPEFKPQSMDELDEMPF